MKLPIEAGRGILLVGMVLMYSGFWATFGYFVAMRTSSSTGIIVAILGWIVALIAFLRVIEK